MPQPPPVPRPGPNAAGQRAEGRSAAAQQPWLIASPASAYRPPNRLPSSRISSGYSG